MSKLPHLDDTEYRRLQGKYLSAVKALKEAEDEFEVFCTLRNLYDRLTRAKSIT